MGWLLVVVGCSSQPGAVTVDAPSVAGHDARRCAALVRALPDRVAGQARRAVRAGGGYAAAWGDPAIVLRCGVRRPVGFVATSVCQNTDGVDWFIPPAQQDPDERRLTMTTVGRSPDVDVLLPSDYFPPANAMVDLARALKQTLREVRPCA